MAKKAVQFIFHPGNCLNLKKPYPQECTLCLQACPHQAIDQKKNIDPEKCTECGACMAVCPSDGFVDKDIDKLSDYLFNSDEIILNCPLAQPQGFEISCLGMLDKDAWSVLMLLAAEKKVRILTGDCGTCRDKQACLLGVEFFKMIHALWQDHPRINIEVLPDKEDSGIEPRVITGSANNKGIKDKLREQGKNTLKALIPDIIAEETYNIPKTRQWLAECLKLSPDTKLPYQVLKADNNCTGCGVCAKICPQGALQLNETQDGITRLIYEPVKCVQCGRCAEICLPKALRFEHVDLSSKYLLGKILLCQSRIRKCTKCGKQIYHNLEPALCLACAAMDPSLKGILY